MAAARNSWGFSLFCDDIRQEIGGKASLMGIFGADMVIRQDFPFLFPKIVIFVKYYEIKEIYSDDLLLNIFMPNDNQDKPFVSQSIKRADLKLSTTRYPMDDDSESIINLTIPIQISPFRAEKEGAIKVRMLCGDKITRLGRLHIRKVRPDDVINFG